MSVIWSTIGNGEVWFPMTINRSPQIAVRSFFDQIRHVPESDVRGDDANISPDDMIAEMLYVSTL